MTGANVRFFRSRHPETGREDVGREVDQLERDLRGGPWPKEAVSLHEHRKQEILPYQRPTMSEETGQMGCKVDEEQENKAAARGNCVKQRSVHPCLEKSRKMTTRG